MAHLFIPNPVHTQLPVFFNVDGAVGEQPAQNSTEDVLLVQFAYTVIGRSPHAKTDPTVLATAKGVKLTGIADAATITAIRTMQERNARTRPGKVVDGRVSPAKVGYSYGAANFTIAHLNNSLQDRFPDIWPRIDKIAGCPPQLHAMVARTVAGDSAIR